MQGSGERKGITGVKYIDMTIKEFAEIGNLRNYTEGIRLDAEIRGGYVSDLLSDVMGNASAGEVWITLQSHLNVIAIASLKELAAVILVKGIHPERQVIEKAIEKNIPLLGSDDATFQLAGKLYHAIVR
jgi:hypothetical protein